MNYACIFSLIPFTNFSAFVTVPCCFYDYSSVVQIEIGISDTSHSSLIIQDCFGYHLFFFPCEAKNYPFSFCEELCWYFAGGYVSVVEIIFDWMAIFTILILPILKHGRSFYLLTPSSISFFIILKFILYNFFPSWLELSQYFL